MRCCHLTRRELLQWAAVVSSTALLPVTDPERTYAAGSRSTLAVPMNAELVTLTESSAIVTWYTGVPGATGDSLQPSPQDTELLLGTDPARLRTVLHDHARTPYHYAEIGGLEPGRTYYYQARSDGVPALPATNFAGNPLGVATTTLAGLRGLADVFAFTTPDPPPGRHLFTLALANDMHMGETVAGLITTIGDVQIPPGVSQVAGEPPYTQVMGKAMVDESKARGAHTLLVAGDLTSEAEPDQLAESMRLLDRFGRYEKDYFVVRGNHDRPHAGTEYASCSVSAHDPSTRDCFKDAFDPHSPTWFATDIRGLRVLGIDTYDRAGNGGDNGKLSAEQLHWFHRQLRDDPDHPTLVFGHHPLTLASDTVNEEPLVFDLELQQSQLIQQWYADAPGVFFHHQGHTHRNYRSASTQAGRVVFQEVGATKEYPGGFSLLRVHEGGFAMNFYKARSALAREWSERTRGEYLGVGLSAFYQSGSIADRNYVVARDLSGLRHAGSSSSHHPSPSPSPSPGPHHRPGASASSGGHRTSPAGAVLPDTGPSRGAERLVIAAGATAAAATATGAAAARLRRASASEADQPLEGR